MGRRLCGAKVPINASWPGTPGQAPRPPCLQFGQARLGRQPDMELKMTMLNPAVGADETIANATATATTAAVNAANMATAAHTCIDARAAPEIAHAAIDAAVEAAHAAGFARAHAAAVTAVYETLATK